ncbi:MAG: zinc ribbon domain-containing protein [Clostridia bacterium]|nr:zinc ribbon domain-containing protein [Clostridia bacterium]
MSFCQNCGAQVQDGAPFCPSCGTAQNAAPVNNGFNGGMPNNMPGNMPGYYVKPKIPGRGAGIAGMVLGIIGLVYSFSCLVNAINYADSFSSYFGGGYIDDGFIVAIVIFSILSILGVSLAVSGRNKGYRNGVSTAGVVTSVIGLAIYLFSIIIVAAA